MRKARVLLFLFLIAGAGLAYYGSRNGWELPPVPGRDAPAAIPPDARSAEPATAVRPTFDIVRAEPTGDLVMAGRAEPGWSVTVESGGKILGNAVADAQGEWVIQPDAPVKKGEHSLELKSQSPKGEQMLFSKQRLALSIGEPSKSRPLVALTEEGAATRVLQMSPAPADDKRGSTASASVTPNLQNPPFKPATTAQGDASPQVNFTSIDYEQGSSGSAVYLAGRGAPGARVMLYVDNEFAGTTTADATGSWTFKGPRELKAGNHMLRADHVELDSGKVLARAEVNFDREGAKAAVALGSATPSSGQYGLASGNRPDPRQAARPDTPDAQPSPTGDNPLYKTADAKNADAKNAADKPFDPGVIIVRRGDTLWQIAERHYGSGAKYTQIFQNNKGQIRNPNLIYPTQRFAVPDRQGTRQD